MEHHGHPPRKPNPPTPSQRREANKNKPIKKRINLNYEQKREVIKLIDGGMTKRRVADKFGVNESTIRGIYSKKEHILAHFEASGSKQRAAAQRSSNQLLLKTEMLLHRYLDKMGRRSLAVGTKELKDVALEIYNGIAT